MSVSIFNLTALAAAPATNDVVAIVDVSDSTQAPQGTTKKITVAFLFTSPTFAGNAVVVGSLTVGAGIVVSGTASSFTLDANVIHTASATGTAAHFLLMTNTTASLLVGVERSTGGGLLTGSSAYDAIINQTANTGLRFGTNNTLAMSIANNGPVTCVSTLTAAGLVATVASAPFVGDNTAAAAVNGLVQAKRGGTLRYFLGFNASDEFAVINAAGSTANLSVTDLGALTVRAGITHGSTTLLTTTATLTNGAASSTATLFNSPVSGDPTKWVSINDNGTIRRIPAW